MSETGRFYIQSLKTGKVYCVEPIEPRERIEWGSVNPSTGEFVHKKGWKKYTGAISEKESIITEENGFKNIVYLEPGQSPTAYLEELENNE
jgi:hypothetical protein